MYLVTTWVTSWVTDRFRMPSGNLARNPPSSSPATGSVVVPMPEASVANIPMPQEIPEPRCTCTVFGRVKVGPVDALLGSIVTFTFISALYLRFSNENFSSWLMGAACGGSGISWGIFRADGSVIEALGRCQRALREEQQVNQRLTGQTQSATQEVDSLKTDNTNQQQRIQELEGELALVKGLLETFRKTMQELENTTQGLQSELDSIHQANESAKDQIKEVSLDTKSCLESVEKLGVQLPQMKEAIHSIQNITVQFSGDLQSHLAPLLQIVKVLQGLLPQFADLLKQRETEANAREGHVKTLEERLAQNTNTLDSTQHALQELSEHCKALTEELSKTRPVVTHALASLSQEFHVLEGISHDQQQQRQLLKSGQDRIAALLAALAKGLPSQGPDTGSSSSP